MQMMTNIESLEKERKQFVSRESELYDQIAAQKSENAKMSHKMKEEGSFGDKMRQALVKTKEAESGSRLKVMEAEMAEM